MNTVIQIGIDVHKDSYSLCSYSFETKQPFGQSRIASNNQMVVKYVRKLLADRPGCTAVCGYEAGPTGYVLYRELRDAGIPCVIMAPTSLPKAPGSRVKNDRLDAQALAQHLAWGTYSTVHVPTVQDEAVKNFTRLRNARKESLKRAKQNLLSFLLLMGRSFNEGKSYWTQVHYTWLKRQRFDNSINQMTFDGYLREVVDQQEKVDQLDREIEILAAKDEYREPVGRAVLRSGA